MSDEGVEQQVSRRVGFGVLAGDLRSRGIHRARMWWRWRRRTTAITTVQLSASGEECHPILRSLR